MKDEYDKKGMVPAKLFENRGQAGLAQRKGILPIDALYLAQVSHYWEGFCYREGVILAPGRDEEVAHLDYYLRRSWILFEGTKESILNLVGDLIEASRCRDLPVLLEASDHSWVAIPAKNVPDEVAQGIPLEVLHTTDDTARCQYALLGGFHPEEAA